MNNDDMSDDEFDAFLNGTDALSRRLQALPQPAPSAQLDETIRNRVQAALALENRAPAANDAVDDTPKPQLARSLGWRWRWRVPAGIAATVLAGVIGHQTYRDSRDAELMEAMPAMQDSAVVPRPQAPVAEAPAMAPPPPQAKAAPARESALSRTKPVLAARAEPAKEEAALSASAAESAPVPVPAPAPAPVASAAPPPPPAAQEQVVVVTGSRASIRSGLNVKKNSDGVTDAIVAESLGKMPSHAIAEVDMKAWLDLIDAMLKAGNNTQALGEWRKFKVAHPDYPVAEELRQRIEAAGR